MSREDDFSVVVFAKNTSGLYRTYRNIKQNPLADTIQILAVRVEGIADQFSQSDLKELQLLGEKEKTLQAQAMDEKFGPFQMKDKRFREMLKDPKLIYIDGSECQDIASELYSQITGTYITFVRGGNGFSKGAFDCAGAAAGCGVTGSLLFVLSASSNLFPQTVQKRNPFLFAFWQTGQITVPEFSSFFSSFFKE